MFTATQAVAACVTVRRSRRKLRQSCSARAQVPSPAAHARESDNASSVTVSRVIPQAADAVSLSRRQAAAALLLSTGLLATAPAGHAASASATSKVFFDIEVDGEPLGRIVIGLFGDASPLATSRFLALTKGIENVGYRRTIIDQIRPGQFIRAAGVRSFSYTASGAPVEVPGGETAERLLPELAASQLKHDAAGLVSLVVIPDVEPEPPKERLIARNGQLVTVQEAKPLGPNGTGFAITLAPAPELDGINLVVGKVLEGEEIVRAVGELPFAKPNANSPYFQVAKSIGDARAKLAEKGFGRPLVSVRIAKSGVV